MQKRCVYCDLPDSYGYSQNIEHLHMQAKKPKDNEMSLCIYILMLFYLENSYTTLEPLMKSLKAEVCQACHITVFFYLQGYPSITFELSSGTIQSHSQPSNFYPLRISLLTSSPIMQNPITTIVQYIPKFQFQTYPFVQPEDIHPSIAMQQQQQQ